MLKPFRCERGETAVEYCLIGALIAGVILLAVSGLGTSLSLQLARFGSAMAAASGGASGTGA